MVWTTLGRRWKARHIFASQKVVPALPQQERELKRMHAYSMKERGQEGNGRKDWRNRLAVVERTSNRHPVVTAGIIGITSLTYNI